MRRSRWLPAVALHLLLALLVRCTRQGSDSSPSAEDQPSRVLFVGADHLGDLLQASLLFRSARRDFPKAQLIFAGRVPEPEFLLPRLALDSAEELDLVSGSFLERLRRFRTCLTRAKIDTVVFLRSRNDLLPMAVAAWIERIRWRVGSTEKGQGPLLTHAYQPTEVQSIVRYQRAVWQNLRRSDADDVSPAWSASVLPDLMFRADVILSPFAQHLFCWTDAQWRLLMRRLVVSGFRTAVVGSKDKREHAASLLRGIKGVRNLVGETSLRDLFAIVRSAHIVVTVCTGTRHIAVATGTRVIVLGNGHEPAASIGPYAETETYLRAATDCSPCGRPVCPYGHMRCVRDISVPQVFWLVQQSCENAHQRWVGRHPRGA